MTAEWRKILMQGTITVTAGLGIALAGAAYSKANSIEQRLSALEAHVFTAQQALDVWKSIADIREKVAGFPHDVPPPWFEARVDRIEVKLDLLQDDVQALKRPVTE